MEYDVYVIHIGRYVLLSKTLDNHRENYEVNIDKFMRAKEGIVF